jgi:hypothetical protein
VSAKVIAGSRFKRLPCFVLIDVRYYRVPQVEHHCIIPQGSCEKQHTAACVGNLTDRIVRPVSPTTSPVCFPPNAEHRTQQMLNDDVKICVTI